MNIFFLSNHPILNARYYGDKHLRKLIVELCQMMYTAHWINRNTLNELHTGSSNSTTTTVQSSSSSSSSSSSASLLSKPLSFPTLTTASSSTNEYYNIAIDGPDDELLLNRRSNQESLPIDRHNNDAIMNSSTNLVSAYTAIQRYQQTLAGWNNPPPFLSSPSQLSKPSIPMTTLLLPTNEVPYSSSSSTATVIPHSRTHPRPSFPPFHTYDGPIYPSLSVSSIPTAVSIPPSPPLSTKECIEYITMLVPFFVSSLSSMNTSSMETPLPSVLSLPKYNDWSYTAYSLLLHDATLSSSTATPASSVSSFATSPTVSYTWNELVETAIAYKPTHTFHPMTRWVRTNAFNYYYTSLILFALVSEYRYRFHKEHASTRHCLWLLTHYPPFFPRNIHTYNQQYRTEYYYPTLPTAIQKEFDEKYYFPDRLYPVTATTTGPSGGSTTRSTVDSDSVPSLAYHHLLDKTFYSILSPSFTDTHPSRIHPHEPSSTVLAYLTPVPLCMPVPFYHPNTVIAYRNYYRGGKQALVHYTGLYRTFPFWWNSNHGTQSPSTLHTPSPIHLSTVSTILHDIQRYETEENTDSVTRNLTHMMMMDTGERNEGLSGTATVTKGTITPLPYVPPTVMYEIGHCLAAEEEGGYICDNEEDDDDDDKDQGQTTTETTKHRTATTMRSTSKSPLPEETIILQQEEEENERIENTIEQTSEPPKRTMVSEFVAKTDPFTRTRTRTRPPPSASALFSSSASSSSSSSSSIVLPTPNETNHASTVPSMMIDSPRTIATATMVNVLRASHLAPLVPSDNVHHPTLPQHRNPALSIGTDNTHLANPPTHHQLEFLTRHPEYQSLSRAAVLSLMYQEHVHVSDTFSSFSSFTLPLTSMDTEESMMESSRSGNLSGSSSSSSSSTTVYPSSGSTSMEDSIDPVSL